MRKWLSFSLGVQDEVFERRLYRMVNCFDYAAVLVDKYPFYHGDVQPYRAFDLLAGFDAIDVIHDHLAQMDAAINAAGDWFLGYFSYDLKNDLESGLSTSHKEKSGFRKLSFFRPRFLLKKNGQDWSMGYESRLDTPKTCHAFIDRIKRLAVADDALPKVDFKCNMSHRQYLDGVEKLKEHIHRGDIYEVNFCMEFFSHEVNVDPAMVFEKLLGISPMPFSALLRDNHSFLMGASPERYLRKRGAMILSQPMKGTIRRSDVKDRDLNLMRTLSESEKERAENIMITDLVRNDLSRSAARGTVKVDELCSVLPFPGVFQMISTVTAQMHHDAHWLDPLKHSFPMGSMTGAPKIKAMELIDRYEKSARGLYSGSVGYITPELDFDFNVVIRSFLYNQMDRYLSYSVGSAITAACDAEDEYEECWLKAKTLRKLFINHDL
ncbi:chorismate-binding protein [Thermophagus sp. OGC60D27]|uniref:chorismate-binding protein n=1 Tax=Thermophagus sp. OGC60D27 TaxID=3458415 RepID=UPI004037E209